MLFYFLSTRNQSNEQTNLEIKTVWKHVLCHSNLSRNTGNKQLNVHLTVTWNEADAVRPGLISWVTSPAIPVITYRTQAECKYHGFCLSPV